MTGRDRGDDPARARRFEGLGFVWAAIAIALLGGFGLVIGLLLGPLVGLAVGRWWAAGLQAHGHAMLVGWAGLMVFGVGLHILPRLRGAPLARSRWMGPALGLLLTGVVLRVVGQPLAAAMADDAPVAIVSLAFGLGGLLTVAGATLVLAMLGATFLAGPPLRERPALRQVLPLFSVAFGVLLVALALNAWLTIVAAREQSFILDARGEALVVDLLLLGFLLPICLAMSARFFPLYLGVRPAPSPGLGVALALLLLGTAARGLASLWPAVRPISDLLVGVGLLVGLWSVGQFAPNQVAVATANPAEWLPTGLFRPAPPPPGRPRPPSLATRAARLLLRCAYGWLLLAALLALAAGVGWRPPADLERHALGAGYVTLLILGMSTLLLPGFLGGSAPGAAVVAAVLLGNAAATLRLLPGLTAWLAPGTLPSALFTPMLGLAGLLGLGAVLCLALIVGAAARSGRQRSQYHSASPS